MATRTPPSSSCGSRRPPMSRLASALPSRTSCIPRAKASDARSGAVSLGLVRLELHDRPSQLLSQSVVYFAAYQVPFVIAGFQQVPQCASFPF